MEDRDMEEKIMVNLANMVRTSSAVNEVSNTEKWILGAQLGQLNIDSVNGPLTGWIGGWFGPYGVTGSSYVGGSGCSGTVAVHPIIPISSSPPYGVTGPSYTGASTGGQLVFSSGTGCTTKWHSFSHVDKNNIYFIEAMDWSEAKDLMSKTFGVSYMSSEFCSNDHGLLADALTMHGIKGNDHLVKGEVNRRFFVRTSDGKIIRSGSGRDGMDCKRCRSFFPMAETNQPDGTLVCFACRSGF